jgi:hypothetical protein
LFFAYFVKAMILIKTWTIAKAEMMDVIIQESLEKSVIDYEDASYQQSNR